MMGRSAMWHTKNTSKPHKALGKPIPKSYLNKAIMEAVSKARQPFFFYIAYILD
jgi:hypothetical protein